MSLYPGYKANRLMKQREKDKMEKIRVSESESFFCNRCSEDTHTHTQTLQNVISVVTQPLKDGDRERDNRYVGNTHMHTCTHTDTRL